MGIEKYCQFLKEKIHSDIFGTNVKEVVMFRKQLHTIDRLEKK